MANYSAKRGETDLEGRVPYKMHVADDGSVYFRWIYVGEKRSTEPFFEQTIATCLSLPQNSDRPMPLTTAEVLIEQASRADATTVPVFIYHVSRCGSTLMGQMLVRDPRVIVLSEVPLLDSILRLSPDAKTDQNLPVKELFDAVITLLTRARSGRETHVFAKTDSWHVLFDRQLREWYPEVPFILLYRSPAEVIASHNRLPGMHAVPGLLPAGWFDLEQNDVTAMGRGEYLAHVLRAYYLRYISMLRTDNYVVPISYHDGPAVMLNTASRICGMQFSPEVMQFMLERSAFHSKNSAIPFTGDEVPQALISPGDNVQRAFEELKICHANYSYGKGLQRAR
jgi:hypothetical protein